MSTRIKLLAIIGGMLLGVTASGAALAWHGGYGHSRFGVFVGVPLFSPWYYPPAYYNPPYPYYPPAVVAAPPVYTEQGGSNQSAPAQQYWYYCNASRAYYPDVNECSGGWQRVAPQPG